jgi:hypothetical protein
MQFIINTTFVEGDLGADPVGGWGGIQMDHV